jgi:hypothetical protein
MLRAFSMTGTPCHFHQALETAPPPALDCKLGCCQLGLCSYTCFVLCSAQRSVLCAPAPSVRAHDIQFYTALMRFCALPCLYTSHCGFINRFAPIQTPDGSTARACPWTSLCTPRVPGSAKCYCAKCGLGGTPRVRCWSTRQFLSGQWRLFHCRQPPGAAEATRGRSEALQIKNLRLLGSPIATAAPVASGSLECTYVLMSRS